MKNELLQNASLCRCLEARLEVWSYSHVKDAEHGSLCAVSKDSAPPLKVSDNGFSLRCVQENEE